MVLLRDLNKKPRRLCCWFLCLSSSSLILKTKKTLTVVLMFMLLQELEENNQDDCTYGFLCLFSIQTHPAARLRSGIKTTLLVVLLFTLHLDSDQETQTFPWLWFLHLVCFHNKIKKINTIGMLILTFILFPQLYF